MFDTIDRALTAVYEMDLRLLPGGLLLLVGAGVFVRFVPVSSMGWADEIIELGFAWLVFFGAAWLWRNRTHFKVDLLQHLLAGTRFALAAGAGRQIHLPSFPAGPGVRGLGC